LCIAQKRARETDSLCLAGGKLGAFFAKHRVEPVGERIDEFREARAPDSP
jgi:hypothetical protein